MIEINDQKQYVNPGVLPSFFKDVEIIGPAHLEIPKYRESHANITEGKVNFDYTAKDSPGLLATKEVRKTYQTSDYKKIKEMQKIAAADILPLRENLKQHGDQAWIKVEKDGKQFYMCWTQKASMWAFPENVKKISTPNGETKYLHVVQFGTYSASTGIAGIQAYNLEADVLLEASAISLLVAIAMAGLVNSAVGYTISVLSLLLVEAAAKLGIEEAAFMVPVGVASAVTLVILSIIVVVVFIGIIQLYNFIHKEYYVNLQIYNWDAKNDWDIIRQSEGNATIPSDKPDEDTKNLSIKLKKLNEVIPPPGFTPIEPLDCTCSYATVIWTNVNKWLEGLSVALQFQKNKGEFIWAFNCPFVANNQQKAEDAMLTSEGLDNYRVYPNWNPHPLDFQIITYDGTPISCSMDALSGDSNNLYNAVINIGK
ncbi:MULTISPECIES: hypothetical protein [Bacillus]|uniref:Uncharacterized protein n=1 Tax=Bacillus sp. BS1807G30 TaxID=3153756 RepID=A0AAU7FL19_9BACI